MLRDDAADGRDLRGALGETGSSAGGETIVARATSPSATGRCVIRLSGPGSRGLLDSMLAGERPATFERGVRAARLTLPPEAGGARGAELPILVMTFPGPASFTGEDVVELVTCGGVVSEMLLASLVHRGARLARPGEFSARAFLNGKMSLTQAEAIAGVIAARQRGELEAARRVLDGTTGRVIERVRDELVTLLALVEAGIDFTDQEDVTAIEPAELARRCARLASALAEVAGPRHEESRVRQGRARAALVGAPSSGKSTLFNALLGRTRAVTSPEPGTTRDVLEEPLDLRTSAAWASVVTLMDLPGLDSAGEGAREFERRAMAAAREADVLVWCDPSGRFEASPWREMARGKQVIRVRTFADRAGAEDGKAVETREDLRVCALDGTSMPMLRRALADASASRAGSDLAAVVPRVAQVVDQMRAALQRVMDLCGTEALGGGLRRHPEEIASALREGVAAADEVCGAVSVDDVLGRIFATFCVGK